MISNNYLEYNEIAKIYGEYWSDFERNLFGYISENALVELKSTDKILDLCCGPGYLIQQLHKANYNVTGLDLSDKMLEIAKENNPNGVEFIHADMRNFNIKSKFKLITCNFDSINHLNSIKDVKKTFSNVYNALEKNGIFLFDINTSATFSKYWIENAFEIDDPDFLITILSSYDSEEIARMKFTISPKNGDKIKEVTITERNFEVKEIKKILLSLGFSVSVSIAKDGRAFFKARK